MGLAPKIGLVLSGGGARAAYQAGVLKGISEILGNDFGTHPFPIITGISAGAINASKLASSTQNFEQQTQELARLWNELIPEHVLKTDFGSLSKIGAGWIKDLSFGGVLGTSQSTHLLNSTPLKNLIESNVSFDQIHNNVLNKVIDGVAITTTSYATGTSVTFFDALTDISDWTRSSRIGLREPLRVEHILASSAIPILFKPIKVGKSFYGDGGIRSTTPFSPAIHMGADRILAIGVRYVRSGVEVREKNLEVEMDDIALSDIAGIMFNSLFLDALEFDHERLQRINQTIELLTLEARSKLSYKLKKIPTLIIQPSVDLGAMAAGEFGKFPRMLRYLLTGIGASGERGADLLSYIAFDKAYTSKLVEVGFRDAIARKEEIRKFFTME